MWFCRAEGPACAPGASSAARLKSLRIQSPLTRTLITASGHNMTPLFVAIVWQRYHDISARHQPPTGGPDATHCFLLGSLASNTHPLLPPGPCCSSLLPCPRSSMSTA